MRDIEGRWNHFIFEDHTSEEYPTYFIDSQANLYKIQFHHENFHYPQLVGKKQRQEILEIIEDCGLANISEFEEASTFEDLIGKLLNIEFEYE